MTQNQRTDKTYPAGREPLGDLTFKFLCDPAVECFNRCCHNPDLELYPYDILRLCEKLEVSSGEFLKQYTYNSMRSNPHFPSIMLKMRDNNAHVCPFLKKQGCSVYEDRPDACRMFPLERAVSLEPFKKESLEEIYYLQKLPYCQGHGRKSEWTTNSWISEQGLLKYNRMGELWAEISLLFRRNPWGPDGSESKNIRMAYMVCFDLDQFRKFVTKSSFLKRYQVDKFWMEKILKDNASLLEFGFDWIKYFMFNVRSEKFSPV